MYSGEDERLDVSKYMKRAGPYLLGPKMGNSPVKCMNLCLARKEMTNEFYNLKIVNLKKSPKEDTLDDQQGKILLHTEYTLLSYLKGQKGIVQQHGIFRDVADEELEIDGKIIKTGKKVSRLCLVLDNYHPHDFKTEHSNLVNLQSYVLREKKLTENIAVEIFYKIVQIVERLHKQNVVHRDLKLGNVTINKLNQEVTISNFCLGKKLTKETQLLCDQRGSPAYISPDVICGKPYLGKPSDMWALGVVLYTMIYGQFPFFDPSPHDLFRKIKAAEFTVPMEPYVSTPIVNIIKSLLYIDPKERLTASQVLEILRDYKTFRFSGLVECDLQVVPTCSQLKRSHEESEATNSYESGKHRTRDYYAIEELLSNATSQADENSKSEEVGGGGDDSEEGVHEPPKKITKVVRRTGTSINTVKIVKVKEDARVLTASDLEKLYAIYQANRQKLAAEQAA